MVEMTLLIPIIIGVLFLYIQLFLYYIQTAEAIGGMVSELYSSSEEKAESKERKGVEIRKSGTALSISIKESKSGMDIEEKWSRYNDCVVENIRRWQFATETISSRRNE